MQAELRTVLSALMFLLPLALGPISFLPLVIVLALKYFICAFGNFHPWQFFSFACLLGSTRWLEHHQGGESDAFGIDHILRAVEIDL